MKALVPIANQEDNYGHMRYNGVLQLQNAMNFIWLGDRTNQNAPRDLIDWEEVYRRLPAPGFAPALTRALKIAAQKYPGIYPEPEASPPAPSGK